MATIEQQNIRVTYEYIKRQQRAWEQDMAPLLGEIGKLTRQMEWQELRSTRCVKFLDRVIRPHEQAIQYVQAHADEGVTAQYHIAATLGEIVAYFQTAETYNRALIETGGIP
jgi:hypothetical protein